MGALVEGLPPYPPSPMLGYVLQCRLHFGRDGSLFIPPQNDPRINFNIGEGGRGECARQAAARLPTIP